MVPPALTSLDLSPQASQVVAMITTSLKWGISLKWGDPSQGLSMKTICLIKHTLRAETFAFFAFLAFFRESFCQVRN